MRRWLSALLLALLLGSAATLGGPSASAQSACEFRLGFKALRDLIPDVVGNCLENEQHNPQNGDGLQRTVRGLLVWRRADNWTAFTDGYRTWVNGPFGLQSRLNTERFAWEPGSAPVAGGGQAPAPPAPPPAAPTTSFSMAPQLIPAWNTILGLPKWGPFYNEWGPKTGVKVSVGTLPEGALGLFRLRENTITMSSKVLTESRFVIAADLSHELFHAVDAAFQPDQLKDCVGEETRAFTTEARVWEETWGGNFGPNNTQGERFENSLLNLLRTQGEAGVRRAVAGSSAYQKQCGSKAKFGEPADFFVQSASIVSGF